MSQEIILGEFESAVAINNTVADAESAVSRLTALQSGLAHKRKLRKNAAAEPMLIKLGWYPVATAKTVERLLGQARRGCKRQLANAGILTERIGKMRYQIFHVRVACNVDWRPWPIWPKRKAKLAA